MSGVGSGFRNISTVRFCLDLVKGCCDGGMLRLEGPDGGRGIAVLLMARGTMLGVLHQGLFELGTNSGGEKKYNKEEGRKKSQERKESREDGKETLFASTDRIAAILLKRSTHPEVKSGIAPW